MNSINSVNPGQLKYLVAGYGLPAEYGITTLFGYGCKPNQIRLLTHNADERNTGLVEMAKLRSLQYQTSSAKDNTIVEWVEEFKPDIILSLHYRSLIPSRILNSAKIGSVNLHPSLLPKYRGANSVAWAIINGEMRTGFSFHHMSESFDTGLSNIKGPNSTFALVGYVFLGGGGILYSFVIGCFIGFLRKTVLTSKDGVFYSGLTFIAGTAAIDFSIFVTSLINFFIAYAFVYKPLSLLLNVKQKSKHCNPCI